MEEHINTPEEYINTLLADLATDFDNDSCIIELSDCFNNCSDENIRLRTLNKLVKPGTIWSPQNYEAAVEIFKNVDRLSEKEKDFFREFIDLMGEQISDKLVTFASSPDIIDLTVEKMGLERLKEQVLENEFSSPALLRKLAMHEDSEIRKLVPLHANTPRAVVADLHSDTNPEVSFRARTVLNCTKGGKGPSP